MMKRTMSDLGLAKLLSGCDSVYKPDELGAKLKRAQDSGTPLRVKLGMDPTAPDIHIGHAVVLRKMRQFQDLGHKAVLIIGDFTSRIGDPTGRSQTRPVLSDEEIEANGKTYFEQAGKILDTHADRLEIRRNSEWLASMGFADVIRLAARMTVGQALKRDDFQQRFESEAPISIHEFLYPLMQGWDSVQIRADVELGGTDQTYNNLVGRDLQGQDGQSPQIVMVMPILRGLDGVRKMSKSYDNYIGLNDRPTDIFGKTMNIPDELIGEWFSLLTDVPEAEWRGFIDEHPMGAKERLASEIGTNLCLVGEDGGVDKGREVMAEAAQWWRDRFGKARVNEPIDVAVASEFVEAGMAPAWVLAWLAHDREISKSQARRMVQGGAFTYAGAKVTDPNERLPVEDGQEFRAGRHRKGERVKQPLTARVRLTA